MERVKVELLAALASLDRGIAANRQEAKEVDEIAARLERLGGEVKLGWATGEQSPDVSTMEMLAGARPLLRGGLPLCGAGRGGRRWCNGLGEGWLPPPLMMMMMVIALVAAGPGRSLAPQLPRQAAGLLLGGRHGGASPALSRRAVPLSPAGTWRLVYSSGFSTGSLGGRRPGPPAALVGAAAGCCCCCMRRLSWGPVQAARAAVAPSGCVLTARRRRRRCRCRPFWGRSTSASTTAKHTWIT